MPLALVVIERVHQRCHKAGNNGIGESPNAGGEMQIIPMIGGGEKQKWRW